MKLPVIFVAFIFIMIYSSCQNTDDHIPIKEKICNINLENSNNPLDSVGIMHNYYIMHIVDSFVTNNISYFSHQMICNLGLDYAETYIINWFTPPTTFELSCQTLDSILATSPEITVQNRASYLEELYDDINAIHDSEMDLEERIDAYKDLEDNPPTFNNSIDSVLYFSGLATIKYSTYLWYPESDCGSGYLEISLDLISFRNKLETRTPRWARIMKSDFIGAWGGALGGAILGPGGAAGGAVGGATTNSLNNAFGE
ncbi:MAG: hypothetical protein IPM92_02915 [Saprospiraceae bacterium]|nr:hypothetical protein [Saprospiraceae bacterium]